MDKITANIALAMLRLDDAAAHAVKQNNVDLAGEIIKTKEYLRLMIKTKEDENNVRQTACGCRKGERVVIVVS